MWHIIQIQLNFSDYYPYSQWFTLNWVLMICIAYCLPSWMLRLPLLHCSIHLSDSEKGDLGVQACTPIDLPFSAEDLWIIVNLMAFLIIPGSTGLLNQADRLIIVLGPGRYPACRNLLLLIQEMNTMSLWWWGNFYSVISARLFPPKICRYGIYTRRVHSECIITFVTQSACGCGNRSRTKR